MPEPESKLAPKYHDVKLDTEYYDDVRLGRKTFEIRFNDRGYQAGDFLKMRETKNYGTWHTGRILGARIGYVHSGLGMERGGNGYVALSLLDVKELPRER